MFDIIVTIVTVFYVLVCLFMILVILLQAGRGGMGTALGGGASQSVFGGGGSSDVLAKVTQFCAASFMVFAMFLAYAGSHSGWRFSELKQIDASNVARLTPKWIFQTRVPGSLETSDDDFAFGDGGALVKAPHGLGGA